MNGDPLLNELRQFADKLTEKNISLVVGGGYGLLLKAKHIPAKWCSNAFGANTKRQIDQRY